MSEDKLTNTILNAVSEDDKAYPEAHYNYYGDRGVVDLYVEGSESAHLYEIKSESAVQNGETGANSILRQFNRMRKFFFKDESWDLPVESVSGSFSSHLTFHLVFTASESNVQHLCENRNMYLAAVQNDVFDNSDYGNVEVQKTVWISLRSEDGVTIPIFHSGYGVPPRKAVEDQFERVGLDSSYLSRLLQDAD